ncbi:phage/plasmid primase, P4 family [Gracilibacillus caseinilyticus]|uniref:Phage/plasmid primase, P4 family n=1 Tax=Gracilibacillus caseinilyticus TaxID=2932256 RepID=A0ABY4ERZ8_9BACI|nr:phage/plasmid primase, P4 family [Gracilibacillus caseinilyticus]UOQ47212.1 phage/plasmid primase, P4 family [Gracilibacillus caseinilyticus]
MSLAVATVDETNLSQLFPSAEHSLKIIKLIGYSKINREQDYSVAKRPFMKKWQDLNLPGLTEKESNQWLHQKGWTGLVIPDGYDVIDIDDQQEGQAIYDALYAADFQFHAIKTVRGYQFFFKSTGKVRGQDAKVLMAGGFVGDYRLSGRGQIVLPSENTEGREWVHIANGDLDEMPIFFERLKKLSNDHARPFHLPVSEGSRNNTMYAHCCRLIEFGYSQKDVLYIVSFLNRYFFVPSIDQTEFANTLRSAFQFEPSGTNYQVTESIPPRQQSTHTVSDDDKPSFNLTEMGNAERLVYRNGQDLKYCVEFEEWLIWNGSTWKQDHKRKIERIAIKTFREMYGEIQDLNDTDERKNLWKWAQSTERSSVFLNSIARAQAMLPVSQEELNQDKYKLNCANGVIDLKTGELLSHDRDRLMTKNTHINYDPQAQCPNWLGFLQSIFKKDSGEIKFELIDFIQKSMGYALTGDTSEQVAFFLWGTGRNGKSTLINIVKDLLGDYSKQTNADTFTTKINEGGINNDIARLHGSRFVSAVESEDGQKLSEALIKQLTGGEPITARFLRKEFFEFMPEFKIFFTTNHKPIVKGDDEGIWRRIRLIPFDRTIPKKDVDKHLPEKLQAELPGILKWAVDGCIKWQKEGLGEPEEVKNATDEYKEEMDLLATFLDERCVINPEVKVQATILHKEYLEWAESVGEYPMKKRAFNNRLVMKGFPKRKSTGNKLYFFGIGLSSDFDEDII